MKRDVRVLKFPVKDQSLVFRIYRIGDYTIDDLVIHHSKVASADMILNKTSSFEVNRKLRNILLGPTKS